MVYTERNIWSSLIVTVIAITAYVVLVLQRAGSGPLAEVDWFPLMAWTIGLSIAGTILLSILWGMLAGLGEPDGAKTTDIRDRDIARMGDRVGQAFLVIAGLVVIVLCALGTELFWIAHTMFFGFTLSAFIGGVAQLVAYRRGLV